MMRKDQAGLLVCVLTLSSYLSRLRHEQPKKKQRVTCYLIECTKHIDLCFPIIFSPDIKLVFRYLHGEHINLLPNFCEKARDWVL